MSSIRGKEYLDYLWESDKLLQYIWVVLAFCVSLTVDGLSVDGNQGIYKFPLLVLYFLMPVPVMFHANTDTESKYQNANSGTGTIVECQYR